MNVYIDLEATQFSKEIISLGAITETGREFYTLVKPQNLKKITPFITKLTGLTPSMYDDTIPTIKEVAVSFWEWCCEENENINIFSFGNFDKVLVEAESKRYPEITELKKIKNRMLNLADVASKILFGTNNSCSLLKCYEEVTKKKVEQTHNALDDAKLLKEFHQEIKNTSIELFVWYEEDYFAQKYIKKHKKGRTRSKKLRNYLNTFCDIELDTLTFEDIEKYLDDSSLNKINNQIKKDYKNLTGIWLKEDFV